MNTLPPAIPLHQNGRRQHEMYYPPPHQPHMSPHYYHGYQQPYPPYAQQQWYPSPGYQQPAPRPYPQYSPMVSSPYPNNPPQMQHRPHPPPHTSSMHSRRDLLSPVSSNASLHVPPPTTTNAPRPQTPQTPPAPPSQRMPYYPPLPWYSFKEGAFPSRGPRRRRKRPAPQSSSIPVELPSREDQPPEPETPRENTESPPQEPELDVEEATPPAQSTPVPEPSSIETPATSHAPSETDSTQPTTPSSATAPAVQRPQQKSGPKISHRPTSSIVTIIPAIPHISLPSRPAKQAPATSISGASKATEEPPTNADLLANAVDVAAQVKEGGSTPSEQNDSSASTAKQAPKSWADLVRTMGPPKTESAAPDATSSNQRNGVISSKTETIADALSSYSVESIRDSSKIAFLEPRGLVNTGNMCYMNSILQVLVFCFPFYSFLDHIGKTAAHSFKSDTPLMDAMIMFMREFPVIDSAVSIEQLRMRLKDNELEQYGEAFIPEFVYQVIRRLPRFSSMRRGHQQDAEEFLGFVLEEMHDECGRSMRSQGFQPSSSGASTPTNGVAHPLSESSGPTANEEWLEVGRKQKAAITRSSGAITSDSPITKIFGGKLRSELRVPGMKNSVTLEPYQPLQLDIGSPNVHNIIDALKGLTRSETLHGEFNSPRGPGSNATKQVTIESLPQVLILHLKRFQYDNTGGTQKIWKKIGYPLDLEIPKEVFPQYKRAGLLAHGALPKYRLIGVVYHHGKNASGGHYTVDVRRQDGREWIRLDDTIIRRIRSEDVAEGGSEEDPKVLAAALEQHKNDSGKSSGNVFDQLDEEENPQPEKEWSQVNGTAPAGKKWSGILDGSVTPSTASGKMTPVGRPAVKDSKVAYLLFYQKVSG